MDLQEIKKLLDKYYQATTNIEEEAILRKFFAQAEVSKELEADAYLFNYQLVSRNETSQSNLDSISLKAKQVKHLFATKWLAVAAGILILLGIFVGEMQFFPQKHKISDAQIAYAETQKILLEISIAMNSGMQEAGELSNLSAGIKQMNNISEINSYMSDFQNITILHEGYNSMHDISKLEEIHKNLTSKN